MTEITPDLLAAHRLTPEEYESILRILGREPSMTELGIFSVMWSEHCSYKSSRLHLKKLPTRSARILQGPGENAGVIDIGNGWAIAFKIESHNHPSFIEPFQGAATGVGGILRDIFTMGARPIAVMDALRFGPPSDPESGARNARIVEGVVSGIAHYGNCFGVPTVGGETMFEPCYNGNPLVNVFALGVIEPGKIFYGKAHGPGNPVIYVGAKTGRDGIHGASMASAEFDEDSSQKRPNVQVGDPFMEKLLLEACLEAMATGAIVGIQDMGAAGLTSSSTEMSSRAGTGIEIDLDRVPQRESGMTAYEIMLSESQERMLLVAQRGRETEVLSVFEKWGLDAAIIGTVTDTGMTVVKHRGEIAASIPSRRLADEAPLYDRPHSEPYRTHPLERGSAIPSSQDLGRDLERLLASPDLCSKRWIWEQYDYMVRTNTLTTPEKTDAAVLRIKETGTSVAMSLDGNGRYCYLDPREGTKLIVAECCLNLSTVGALPVATTNNLNFGNPERPEIMAQIVESIGGMAEACTFFDVPVTGGNVSLYNETLGTPIFPTPVVGIVGLIDGQGGHGSISFKECGRSILLLGGIAPGDDVRFGSSQYAKVVLDELWGLPPALDLAEHKRVQAAIRQMVRENLVESAHDVGDGGLAVALAECSFHHGIGAEVDLRAELRPEFLLFAEAPGRVLVSCGTPERIQQVAEEHGIAALEIGKTVAGRIEVRNNGDRLISTAVASLKEIWSHAFEQHLEKHAALVTATGDESCRS